MRNGYADQCRQGLLYLLYENASPRQFPSTEQQEITVDEDRRRAVPRNMSVQTSARSNDGDGRRAPRRSPRAKAISRPAKRANASGTGHPSLSELGVAVEGPWDPADDADAEDHVISTAVATTLPSVIGRRPKQVLAAMMLVQGQQAKQVAATLGIAPETLSRWRHRPEFEALMRELLQDTVDATRLGLVSLCAESIVHLRGLVRSFSDDTALKAITLVLGKVGPVLGVIGNELRR
jgi:transposase-like protein